MNEELKKQFERPVILIRGTKEWDDREKQRQSEGCVCLSYGDIESSISTNGWSALQRPGN